MNIAIGKSSFGNGVFALKHFEPGEIIEIAPVIKSSITEIKHGCNNDHDYVYEYGEGYVIVLGFGSLYNHSFTPNAMYIRDEDNNTMIYAALTHIEKGQQIFINYNGDIYCKDQLWFDC